MKVAVMRSACLIEAVPDDTLGVIFNFLPLPLLLVCRRTSSRWRAIIDVPVDSPERFLKCLKRLYQWRKNVCTRVDYVASPSSPFVIDGDYMLRVRPRCSTLGIPGRKMLSLTNLSTGFELYAFKIWGSALFDLKSDVMVVASDLTLSFYSVVDLPQQPPDRIATRYLNRSVFQVQIVTGRTASKHHIVRNMTTVVDDGAIDKLEPTLQAEWRSRLVRDDGHHLRELVNLEPRVVCLSKSGEIQVYTPAGAMVSCHTSQVEGNLLHMWCRPVECSKDIMIVCVTSRALYVSPNKISMSSIDGCTVPAEMMITSAAATQCLDVMAFAVNIGEVMFCEPTGRLPLRIVLSSTATSLALIKYNTLADPRHCSMTLVVGTLCGAINVCDIRNLAVMHTSLLDFHITPVVALRVTEDNILIAMDSAAPVPVLSVWGLDTCVARARSLPRVTDDTPGVVHIASRPDDDFNDPALTPLRPLHYLTADMVNQADGISKRLQGPSQPITLKRLINNMALCPAHIEATIDKLVFSPSLTSSGCVTVVNYDAAASIPPLLKPVRSFRTWLFQRFGHKGGWVTFCYLVVMITFLETANFMSLLVMPPTTSSFNRDNLIVSVYSSAAVVGIVLIFNEIIGNHNHVTVDNQTGCAFFTRLLAKLTLWAAVAVGIVELTASPFVLPKLTIALVLASWLLAVCCRINVIWVWQYANFENFRPPRAPRVLYADALSGDPDAVHLGSSERRKVVATMLANKPAPQARYHDRQRNRHKVVSVTAEHYAEWSTSPWVRMVPAFLPDFLLIGVVLTFVCLFKLNIVPSDASSWASGQLVNSALVFGAGVGFFFGTLWQSVCIGLTLVAIVRRRKVAFRLNKAMQHFHHSSDVQHQQLPASSSSSSSTGGLGAPDITATNAPPPLLPVHIRRRIVQHLSNRLVKYPSVQEPIAPRFMLMAVSSLISVILLAATVDAGYPHVWRYLLYFDVVLCVSTVIARHVVFRPSQMDRL